MVVRWGLVIILVAMVGCDSLTKKNPLLCCTSAEDCAAVGLSEPKGCDDGLTCIFNACTLTACDADSDCGPGAPRCAPDAVCVGCLDDADCERHVCDPDTRACRACESNADCPDGFCGAGTCHLSIVPTFLPTACDTFAADDLVLASDIDTSDDLQCSELVAQVGGPEICVIRARTISIPTGVEIVARGTRALALIAADDLTLAGVLDISADGRISGPGGGSETGGSASSLQGGGGGGFRTNGGSGGTTSIGGAANGGVAQPDPAIDGVLRGGTIGGGASGGAGGGANLVSCRGIVNVSGVIDAGGGGGRAGRPRVVPIVGGSGGGSGGYVAIEGAAVVVTGQVFANGGGGGGFRTDSTGHGADADRSLSVALGGLGGADGCCTGGNGGFETTSPGDGGPSGPPNSGAGGGGGSCGFLQTFTPIGVEPDIGSAIASPRLEPNRNVATR